MTFISRKLRIQKLKKLLPICPFVDFDDGEYRLMFPYPDTKQYAEFDRKGRVTNYVDGSGKVVVAPTLLLESTSKNEYRYLGDVLHKINRRINYLYSRYFDEGRRSVVARKHHGHSKAWLNKIVSR